LGEDERERGWVGGMLRKNQGVGGIWGGGREYSDVLDGFGG